MGTNYERLTALDRSFLDVEAPNAYMHVATTQVFEAGPVRNAEGGIDADAMKRLIAAQLHRIPRYRQKLARIPVLNQLVWIDDDRFNLDYHLRHTSLPRPGSEEQLKRLSARIMQQHLDRRRPLWEIWLVEGLEGDRFALISKVHHCMVDGISGVDLMMVLMSLTPEVEIGEPPPYLPQPVPSGLELLRGEAWRRLSLPFDALRDFSSFAREAEDLRGEIGVRARALAETLGSSLRAADETPLNREIGPQRRFDWLTMDLAEVKALRKALGGSLNDVVLAIVTGAVREFLVRRQWNPGDIRFRVMAPVSTRSQDQRGTLGNQVANWYVDLPIDSEDPRQQIERISQQTARLKHSQQALGAAMLTQVAEWTPSTLMAVATRAATRRVPFNLVVTNVPGPQIPLYMLGARMLEVYPHVPLVSTTGLGIALMSYDGKLCWGFNADYDLLPDLGAFVAGVRGAQDRLRRAAAEVQGAERKRARRRAN